MTMFFQQQLPGLSAMIICLCHLRRVAKERRPGYLAECLRVARTVRVVIDGREVKRLEIPDAEVTRIHEEYRIMNNGG